MAAAVTAEELRTIRIVHREANVTWKWPGTVCSRDLENWPCPTSRALDELEALRRLAVLLQTNHLADVGQTEPDVIEALLIWAEQVAWPHSGYDPATPWRALAAELREALADWQQQRGGAAE